MRYGQSAALCAGLLLASIGACGQSLSGSMATRIGWWCQSDDLDPRSQYATLKVSGKVGDPENPSAQYQAELRADYDPSSEETSCSIRETWIKAFLGPVDLSIGKQLVSWGTMDVFQPLDVVNPRDYTLPPDSVNEKIPLTMLRSVFNGDRFTAELIVVPFFTESTSAESRWQASPSLPSGVAPTVLTETPNDSIGNMEYGGRLQKSFDVAQGADVACSVFNGRETTPTVDVLVSGGKPPSVTIDKRFRRFLMAGLDGAFAFDNGVLLKFEGDYTTYDKTPTLAPDANCASSEGLVGWEYTILEVKTIGEFDAAWVNDGGEGSWTKTALLILSEDFGSRLSCKLTGGYNFDGSEFLAPEFTYTLADGLSIGGKAYAFWGDSTTSYGQWRENDVIEATVKYSF
jgi:hypothetical protein